MPKCSGLFLWLFLGRTLTSIVVYYRKQTWCYTGQMWLFFGKGALHEQDFLFVLGQSSSFVCVWMKDFQNDQAVFSQCDELKMPLLLKSTRLRWNGSVLQLVFHVSSIMQEIWERGNRLLTSLKWGEIMSIGLWQVSRREMKSPVGKFVESSGFYWHICFGCQVICLNCVLKCAPLQLNSTDVYTHTHTHTHAVPLPLGIITGD